MVYSWKNAICDGDVLHVSTEILAHILNVIVGDGLTNLGDSIVGVRNWLGMSAFSL